MPSRRLPIGAELQDDDGTTHFRVWAPNARQVVLVLEDDPASGTAHGRTVRLDASADGYHEGTTPAPAGSRYRFRLGDRPELLPDPASRFQPDGPFGPSVVVDPRTFQWSDAAWRGIQPRICAVYELHVGTFTQEGTWQSAIAELPALADLGVTVIEMMPIADFPGHFGWGYDGVNLFAPTRLYGHPDDLRMFVDRAHALGIGVILDVVYNHMGPSGSYFHLFSDDYFSRHETEWGRAINFDGPHSGPVREFFLANAGYWIDEFHFDGLRLDATQSIVDSSRDHIVAALQRRVRESAGHRSTWVVAENEKQESIMARPADKGGYGLDALWNDDFHHSAIVALTGRREAYYTDYLGQPQEFIAAAKHGFLYQGQWYRWQKKRRGQPSMDLWPWQLVTFLENHDQVANSASGLRLHQSTSPAILRAFTGLLLLGPWTPMLFQGQEFDSSAPFLYFADHEPTLATLVREGRTEFLRQFARLDRPDFRPADPGDGETFQRCKLRRDSQHSERSAWKLHRDLLQLRRSDPTLAAAGAHGVDGAVLSSHAFAIRLFGAPGTDADRLIVVNLGSDTDLMVVPEPLLAPPCARRWCALWSSEHPRYGGEGVQTVETNPGWRLVADSTVLLSAEPSEGGS